MDWKAPGAALALCALTTTAAAQDVAAPGFAIAGSQPNPAPFAAYHTLSSGDRIVFDGTSVDLYDGNNAFLMNLGTLPEFVFSSFVEADPGETYAVIGESSAGELYRVELDGGGLTPLATLAFNYDAVFEDATHLLVSAATCGFGCGNEIHRVDARSGATSLVAQVPGSAGPVAMAADGSLLYATISDTFPPPAGSSSIVSWSPAQLGSGTTLGLGDAALFHGGFDGAASLAVDPVLGNVFLAESVFGATSSVLELTQSGELVGAALTSTEFLTNLELRAGGGPGHFHAYQPPDGVFLHYSNGDIATARPARPQGAIHVAGGVTTFEVTGAVPNSAMVVLLAPRSGYGPTESAYALFPDFLFVTGIELDALRRYPVVLPVDASGTGTYSFSTSTVELGDDFVLQGLIMDATATSFVASSTAAVL